ncbi:MAG TPA: YDG domain-containing protein, partial [Candidatus Dormibacteraeota bacterium]|nr:YDG domain-containing protein [Candidatus Dormibacteraeota bacterium]
VLLTGTRTYDGTSLIAAGNLTILNNQDGANLTLAGTGALSSKAVGSRTISLGAPLRVNSATGDSGANQVTSFNVTVPAAANGNTLIAVISTRGASADRVSSLNQTGATWSRASQAANANGTTTEIWYAPNVSGAGTTVTINLAASLRAAAVMMEYSGVLTAAPVDQTASGTGSSTSPVTGTTPTTTRASELWIGGIGFISSTPTLGTILNSFASIGPSASTNGTAANNAKVYALEKIVTETGIAASGGTLSASAQWAGAMATFKAAIPGMTLGGSAAGNYTLAGLGSSDSVNITPKQLTITGLTGVNRPYNGTTAATATGTAALNGVISPDVVTLG